MRKLLTITAIGGAICSYMINARTQFLQYDKYLAIIDFWVTLGVTYILLAIYMLWVTLMHYLCFNHNRESVDTNGSRSLYRQKYYFLLATVPVIVLHLAMLHIVFRQQDYTLLDSGYLLYDFSFFLIPLVAYAVMVYYRPEWSIFYRVIRKWIERLIGFVLKTHRPMPRQEVVVVLPSAVSADEKETVLIVPEPPRPSIPLVKLLFLEFRARKAIFYTITGERIVVSCTSSVLRDWQVGAWFVQIRKGFYVNMWHIGHSRRSRYKLRLNAEVQQLYVEGMQMEDAELEKKLHVSKDLRKNIAHYFNNRDQLSSVGWDEVFYY